MLPTDKAGSVRTEQLKLVASHMAPFVEAMRSALQQRAWERSPPVETSGQPQASNVPSPGKGSNGTIDESLVDSQLVGMLVAMGFSRQRAVRAALETGNAGGLLYLHILHCTVLYHTVLQNPVSCCALRAVSRPAVV